MVTAAESITDLITGRRKKSVSTSVAVLTSPTKSTHLTVLTSSSFLTNDLNICLVWQYLLSRFSVSKDRIPQHQQSLNENKETLRKAWYFRSMTKTKCTEDICLNWQKCKSLFLINFEKSNFDFQLIMASFSLNCVAIIWLGWPWAVIMWSHPVNIVYWWSLRSAMGIFWSIFWFPYELVIAHFWFPLRFLPLFLGLTISCCKSSFCLLEALLYPRVHHSLIQLWL